MADWMRLDNAALIFPAVRRKGWSNSFRLSVSLTARVDEAVLQQAVDELMPRFPSMYMSLHRGFFWYYLQKLKEPPKVQKDGACPLIHMTKGETRQCCLRILYYENRIALECFHVLTDGTGGMVYLKTLTAKYLSLKFGLEIPAKEGVLDWNEGPKPEELEDSFSRSAGQKPLSRREENSIHLKGARETDGFLHLTAASLKEEQVTAMAHKYDCSVTAFFSAVMLLAIMDAAGRKRRNRWAKITIPVNLRRLFGGETMRNFVLTVNVGVDPKLGTYTLEELCKTVQGQLNIQVTPKQMAARIAANVQPAQQTVIRMMPLFVKNIALRLVYRSVGEKKGTLNISNLGRTSLPESMRPYVQSMDFIIGPQATYFNNCSVVTYDGTVRVSMIRSIAQNDLERAFLTRLVELGLEVTVESNNRKEKRVCTVCDAE